MWPVSPSFPFFFPLSTPLSFHTPSIPSRPGLSLWQVPPYTSFFFSSFPLYSLPRTYSVSLRPGLSLWQVPPYYPPFWTILLHHLLLLPPSVPLLPTKTRLAIVAGPALLSFPRYLLHIFSPFLPALQARLVIVAGPAVFLLLFFSSLAPRRPFPSPRPGLSLWQVPPFPSPLTYPLGPSLALSHPSLPLTSSLLQPRARRPPWEIQSDLAAALSR